MWNRIYAILLQEIFITKRSLEVVMDLPYFSFASLLIFGFIASFLTKNFISGGANFLLIGIILWEILRVAQYSMSVEALWNVWSRNLSNMFISPLSIKEYFIAQIISSTIKSLIIFLMLAFISLFLFHFNIFVIGWVNFILFFLNMIIFAWSTGILILGAIFRFGTRIQSLAWGLILLLQPLTAAMFPIKVLPRMLQTIAWFFPPTYVFEAARASLTSSLIDWPLLTNAFILNIFYFALSLVIFNLFFQRSKDVGQFARNEN